MKLGCRGNNHKRRAAIRHYANQPTHLLWPLVIMNLWIAFVWISKLCPPGCAVTPPIRGNCSALVETYLLSMEASQRSLWQKSDFLILHRVLRSDSLEAGQHDDDHSRVVSRCQRQWLAQLKCGPVSDGRQTKTVCYLHLRAELLSSDRRSGH